MAKRPQNNRRKILDAALDCAAEARWGDVSLSKIAKEADVSLKQLYAEFASKADIVAAIIVQTTTSVVEGTDPSAADEPAHDRLLDAILRRFDASHLFRSLDEMPNTQSDFIRHIASLA